MDLNPFSHAFHEDPYPVYRWLREHAPVYRSPEGWYALSRYDDVLEASQQPIRFSSAQGTSLELIDTAAMLPMIIFMDPPHHDRQRKLVSRAFTPRAISDLEPFVRTTAARFLDALAEQGGGDFVEEFSAVLPMNVIMELLGVPEADRNQVRKWMDASLERNAVVLSSATRASGRRCSTIPGVCRARSRKCCATGHRRSSRVAC
jgi:cytochrome P450